MANRIIDFLLHPGRLLLELKQRMRAINDGTPETSSQSLASIKIDMKRNAELTLSERQSIQDLCDKVYRPAQREPLQDLQIAWAPHDYCTLLSTDGSTISSYIGIVLRDAVHNGNRVKIGGISGVKTHPKSLGCGFARAGLILASSFLANNLKVDFSLLVCNKSLVIFYEKLGWSKFNGRLVVDGPNDSISALQLQVMVLKGTVAAPLDGEVNLNGLPW